jgi:eukaryotic-like serine/threonine-protein kinase
LSQLELLVEDAAAIPDIGTILDGKFRIDGVLGNGGMAVVLAATHLQLEQRVAIKLLLPECAENPEVVSRFLVEGRAASKIRSEHVVRVIDVGVDGERPYLVMEYLDGVDLNALIARDGPLPSALAIDYVLQACEAIAEAHVSGIIHRDLKPANLFLTHRADGAASVKVLDFGISKILRPRNSGLAAHETSPLLLMGSPHYMSPEQMKSARSVDQRSDLWSLGAILHELVAGTPPFDGSTITALCAAIMTEEPPALSSLRGDLAPELDAVVRRCLEKEPADRFANVAEFAAALAPLGSEAARDSALCIARVLDGGSDADRALRPTVSAPPPPGPDDRPATDDKLATQGTFAAGEPPAAEASPFAAYERERRGDRRSLESRGPRSSIGLLAGFVALLVAGAGVAWFLGRGDRVAREAELVPQTALVLAPPEPPAVASAAALPAPHPPVHPRVFVASPRAAGSISAPPGIAIDPSSALVPALEPAPPGTAGTSDEASTDNPY